MSNFTTNTKNILKKFNKEVVEPKLNEKADKNSTYTKEEIDSLLQNSGGSGSVDNAWVQVALDKKVDKTELEEYKSHTHEEYAKKKGYRGNRILITNASGEIIAKDDLLPTQLNHLANVTSDIQEQLINRSTLDHKHEEYLTQEDLDALEMFSGLAQDVDYNPEISSTLNSTNVQEAIDEVAHKIVDLAHVVSENNVELQGQISDATSDISKLNRDKLNKDEVGVSVAELENGKLKKSQLPDHTHTDYIPHEHEQYALKTDVKDSVDNLNEKLNNHTHKEFDKFSEYAKVNHTHKEFEDLAGSHVHPEFEQLGERINDLSDEVSDNRTDITRLQADKSNIGHKHQDLIDRLDAIDIEILDHHHKEFDELSSSINANASEISKLQSGKADKDHLDSHLPDLDKRYAKADHTHDFNTTHNHDDRYAKIDHTHDYSGQFADILHNHNDVYAEKVHTHSDYANKSHTHSEYAPYVHGHAEIDELREDVDAINVTIESLATKEEVTQAITSTKEELSTTITSNKQEVDTKLASKSDITHKHNYEELENIPNEFNPKHHTHLTNDIEGLLEFVKSNGAGQIYPVAFNETEEKVINKEYYYGDVRRYLNNLNEAEMHYALASAVNGVGYAFIPRDFTVNLTRDLNLISGYKLIGEDKYTSKIKFSSSSFIGKLGENTVIKNITIEKASDGSKGLSVNGANVLIEDVIVKNSLQAIYMSDGLNNVTIRNCELVGYSTTSSSSQGVYVQDCDNFRIEGTKITGFNQGICFYSDSSKNTKIIDCYISSNNSGIYFGQWDATSTIFIDNTQFISNTTIDLDSTRRVMPYLCLKNSYFSAATTSTIAINSTNITKFYMENCIFVGYTLAIKNKDGRTIEVNSCNFISCTTKYEYSLSVLVYEETLKNAFTNPYPVLDSETGVVDNSFPYADVRRYGAISNNTVTDETALTNALNSFGVAIIPSNFTLSIGAHIEMANNTKILGESKETSVLKFIKSSVYCIKPKANVVVKDLTITKESYGYEAIQLYEYTRNLRVENVIMKNVNIGIDCNIVSSTVTERYAENIVVKNCEIYGTNKTGAGIEVRGVRDLTVEGVLIQDFEQGISFYSSNTLMTTDIKFNNCKILNNSKGVYLHATKTESSIIINGCKFAGNQTIDIDSTACSIPLVFVKDCHFTAYDNSSIAIDSVNIVKFYIENNIFLNYTLAVKNHATRKFEANNCQFVNCTTEYENPASVIILEDSATITYPILDTETGVTDVRYPYSHIMRYGGTPLTTSTIPSTTKNHTAIQNAISSTGKCYVPAGEWLLTSICNITKDAASIFGDGMGTTVISYKTNSVYINFTSRNHVRFKDFTIQGAEGIVINYGLYCNSDTVGLYIDNVRVSNVKTSGVHVSGYASGHVVIDKLAVINPSVAVANIVGVGLYLGENATLMLTNSEFTYLNTGVKMGKTNIYKTSGKQTFVSNRFNTCTYGVALYGMQEQQCINFTTCIFYNTQNTGIYSSASITSCSVSACSFVGHESTGIGIGSSNILQLASTGNTFASLATGISNGSSVYNSQTYNVLSVGDMFTKETKTRYSTPAKVQVIGFS